MAAYAALVSLAQTLQNFIQRHRLVDLNQKLQDLTQKSSSSFSPEVSSTLVCLTQMLGNLVQQKQQQDLNEQRKHFDSLHQKVTLLQDIFDKFPRRVGKWEAKIRDHATIAESSFEFLSDAFGIEGVSATEKGSLYLVTEKLGAVFDLTFEEIKREVELTADEANTKLPAGIQSYGNHRNFGLDHHLSEIRQRLVSHESHVQILPIVGMGGIGKTTLARAVFDDPAVRDFFDLHRWVTVSQNYSAKSVLLIILDDIWDLTAWDEVQRLLREDNKGSRVLLTTRHENVARYTRSSGYIYHLPLMNQETSWSLLQYRVFGEEHCPPELIETGQRIANGCRGLPLAIVVVAGILVHVNVNQDSWENIAKDVNEAIRTSDDHFSEILALSYHHLPHHLRPCFLYMGAFHKDDHISVSNLLKLLVAEGFLIADKKHGDIEETAYEFLEELLKRNLIMATKKGYNGRTKLCRMHDLLRDLSINKAQEEMFLLHNYHTEDSEISSARRASFHTDASIQFISKQKLIHFRSALCFCNHDDLLSWLQNCNLLRVFDASRFSRAKLPPQITKFSHLRLLSLTRTPEGIFEVPTDIHKLEDLETLTLKYQYRLNEVSKPLIIPAEIWRLPKLRHLRLFPVWDMLHPTTGNISSLVNLQTLQEIRNIRFTEEIVKLIPNVRKMVVSYQIHPNTERWSDYCLNNLCHLEHLENLRLKFDTFGYDLDWCEQNPLMGILTFPSSLKVLKIDGGAGRASWEDMSRTVGSFPNLQVLKLGFYSVSGDVWETKEDDFQSLRVLKIAGSYLKCWITESSNPFPRLEHLFLIACPYLTELPDSFGEIPTLQTITVDDRQEAIVDWAEQIEEEQRDLGNEYLKVLVLKYAEAMKGEEPEKAKSKLLEMWKAADGDSTTMKMALLSMFADDIDGLKRMAEMVSRDLYENKQQNDPNPSQV